MFNKEEAFNKISELVERFDDQKEFYKKSDYNETLTRKDYIDPFFEALGWDMNNKLGAWEAYREVIHEDRLKIAEQTKAPDYSFRLLGGQRLFFVESKSSLKAAGQILKKSRRCEKRVVFITRLNTLLII